MIYDKNKVELLRQRYPEGTRICLEHMEDLCPVESGTCGTVEFVDDAGTLHCKFDNGRMLGVIPDVDQFHRSIRNRLRLMSRQRKILSARKLQKRRILKNPKKWICPCRA